MSNVQCVWPAHAILGEGPLWSARENALYWVDVKATALHRLSLTDNGKKSWPLPHRTGWVIERRDQPGFMVGTKAGFAKIQLDPFSFEIVGDPEGHLPDNRFNDAKADCYGRIWAGTMDDEEKNITGSLWKLNPDLSWEMADTGYRVSNGPAFSPDGRWMYHTDSAKRVIYRFELEDDGTLHTKAAFIRFQEDWGYPDGMTTDCEGGLWVAHWDGGRISRFAPNGRLERSIALPVSRPTSCAFAGANLDRLFVTSARIGRENEELAGGLFEVSPGVIGLPPGQFAG